MDKLFLLLTLFVCMAIGSAKHIIEKEERFKCWFGEPLPDIDTCSDETRSDGTCPDNDYVCVERYDFSYEPEVWVGCCPSGKGPCDRDTQLVDPSIPDWVPPDCDDNGLYEPEQCNPMAGCSCVFPNGTYIEDTTTEYGDVQIDCNSIVDDLLSG